MTMLASDGSSRHLARVARAVNLSPSRLRHLFKVEVGVSVSGYIRVQRIERAKSLLTATFLSVKQIAAQVNAPDVSHFVRDFKERVGLTPSTYRQRHRIVSIGRSQRQ
jgi:AraC family transcriptional regulator of arabinose operon